MTQPRGQSVGTQGLRKIERQGDETVLDVAVSRDTDAMSTVIGRGSDWLLNLPMSQAAPEHGPAEHRIRPPSLLEAAVPC